jgi:hypothetical protein
MPWAEMRVRPQVNTEGVLSLWRSNGVNCIRIVPVYALKFGMNDTFKALYARRGQDLSRGLDTWQLVASGASAGIVQGTLTFPLDLVKTRLALAKDMGVKYDGMVHCFKHTYATEGARGWYKGFGLSLFVVAPYVAIQVTVLPYTYTAGSPPTIVKATNVRQSMCLQLKHTRLGATHADDDVRGGAAGAAGDAGTAAPRTLHVPIAPTAAIVPLALIICVWWQGARDGTGQGILALGGTKAVAGAVAGFMTQTITYPGLPLPARPPAGAKQPR